MNHGTNRFYAQARLAAEILPYVTHPDVFVLKGGTHINLFCRDLPRLSVDIDLVFTGPGGSSDKATKEILRTHMKALKARLSDVKPGGYKSTLRADAKAKVTVKRDGIRVKTEASPIGVGTYYRPVQLHPQPRAQEILGIREPVWGVTEEEAYAGKMCAALYRQMPRDIFDIMMLYEHGGISDDLFKTFAVYVACNSAHPRKLLCPAAKLLNAAHTMTFAGMSEVEVPVSHLIHVRNQLLADVRKRMDRSLVNMLLSLHDAEPDFGLIDRPSAERMHAIQRKVQNLRHFRETNPEAHAAQRAEIEGLLGRTSQTGFTPKPPRPGLEI